MTNSFAESTVNGNILVVDDTPLNLGGLVTILSERGHMVRPASSASMALRTLEAGLPDLILLDIRMPDMDGYELCEKLKSDARTRDIPIIFISALTEVDEKVKGFESGGVDYIAKPFQAEEVLARVDTHLTLRRYQAGLEDIVRERTVELQQALEKAEGLNTELQDSLAENERLREKIQVEHVYLQEEIRVDHDFTDIIGQNQEFKYMLFKVRQVAETDTTVLITGETGTGKELVARALHAAGNRKDRPLIKVNCATLPANLIESELFGHEKGAFTGAVNRQIGRFELADGGTIFLDEIGELPLELQPKLLRVIQEGEFERLGNPRIHTVDVRIIAATNRDLKQAVLKERFRQDLYYRLNVYPVSVPPLRDRSDDIPLLVNVFVQKYSKKLGKQIDRVPQKTLDVLQSYVWPGNIRELENVVERSVITSPDNTLRVELPSKPDFPVHTGKTLEHVEREYIIQVLNSKDWRVSGPKGAAAILGMNPATLRSRMSKLGIQKPHKKLTDQ